MIERFRVAGFILAVGLMTGCASTDKKADGEVTDAEETGVITGEGARTTGVMDGGTFQGHPLDDPSSPLYQRVIYFDFDSSTISPRDREALAAHAAFLAQNPGTAVNLEGHADERGSREYNIGLGERRSLAVRRVLEFHGVPRRQLTYVSYGEEKPVAFGHDESAWRLNRRVELVYPRY